MGNKIKQMEWPQAASAKHAGEAIELISIQVCELGGSFLKQCVIGSFQKERWFGHPRTRFAVVNTNVKDPKYSAAENTIWTFNKIRVHNFSCERFCSLRQEAFD